MSATNGYISTAAERRSATAKRAASLQDSLKAQAAMTLDEFIALKISQSPPAADCIARTREWATARHAELQIQFPSN